MKSILISIKPKWVAKILNGEKTIEIRKTMPKCELPIDVYIYCTKENKAINCGNDESLLFSAIQALNSLGKVVAKFTLNKVEEIKEIETIYGYKRPLAEYLKESCLSFGELEKYLNCGVGYAWHISNLVIFDKPKELGEFRKWYEIFESSEPTDILPDIKLTKAPQSWQFIETGE